MTDKDILISDLNDISEILNNNGYGRWCETIRKAVVLLKEQENCEDCAIAIEDRLPVVRCKDCKWSKPEKVFKNVPASKDMVRWCELITRYVDDDWFCADGVAKDINVLGKKGR